MSSPRPGNKPAGISCPKAQLVWFSIQLKFPHATLSPLGLAAKLEGRMQPLLVLASEKEAWTCSFPPLYLFLAIPSLHPLSTFFPSAWKHMYVSTRVYICTHAYTAIFHSENNLFYSYSGKFLGCCDQDLVSPEQRVRADQSVHQFSLFFGWWEQAVKTSCASWENSQRVRTDGEGRQGIGTNGIWSCCHSQAEI